MEKQIEELERSASAVKNWRCDCSWMDTSEDNAAAAVGDIDEDGNTYPVITIDCEQYLSGNPGDSGKMAGFYARANPSAVLALIDRLKKAEAELERERMRLAACGVVALADTPESAAKAREMRDEYRSASCDDVARRVDECMELRAERDALAAKLKDAEHDRDEFRRVMNGFAEKMAELEGQEPVAWMTANREMTSFVNFHDDDLPLYARQVPAERPVNARLLDVATGKTPHLYEGRCPDYVNGPESRDPDCPACQAIVSAEAQQERLLQDMHDAGREIDRVMAEPEQKAVRLTEAEIAKALASAGLKPEDYREDGEILPLVVAIESAALRKNGLALED